MAWRAAALAIVLTLPCCASAKNDVEPKAQAVIDRTRTTRATYSVYNWNVINLDRNSSQEEWAAEFHQGHLHRVETPRDRIVADCAAMTAIHRHLPTGQINRGAEVARAACGVQAVSEILSANHEGKIVGDFGETDLISVRDDTNLRTYTVASNGAIVGATIEGKDGSMLLEMVATGMESSVPTDVFSEASLDRSFVPEKYRRPPD